MVDATTTSKADSVAPINRHGAAALVGVACATTGTLGTRLGQRPARIMRRCLPRREVSRAVNRGSRPRRLSRPTPPPDHQGISRVLKFG
jgi:hypothetical protein